MSYIVLHRGIKGVLSEIVVDSDKTLSLTTIGNRDYYCIHDSVVKPNLAMSDLVELGEAKLLLCDSIIEIDVKQFS